MVMLTVELPPEELLEELELLLDELELLELLLEELELLLDELELLESVAVPPHALKNATTMDAVSILFLISPLGLSIKIVIIRSIIMPAEKRD